MFQSFVETWHNSEKNIHGPSHVQNSVFLEMQPFTQTTKSSSSGEIDMNFSEEPADISSEEVDETILPKKESDKEGQLKDDDGNGLEEEDEKEDEDDDDEEDEGKEEEQEEEEGVEEEEVEVEEEEELEVEEQEGETEEVTLRAP